MRNYSTLPENKSAAQTVIFRLPLSPSLPSECLNHEAVHLVSKSCYGKQKCIVAVSNRTFRDPCFPGTRKYLSVLYSCGTSLRSLIHKTQTRPAVNLRRCYT